MVLDEATFLREAERTLTQLFDLLESVTGDFDIDIEEGDSITITLDDGGTYIVSKHTPTQQLWLSSPRSGASHYRYQKSDSDNLADHWRDTRSADEHTAISLKEKLFSELKEFAAAEF